MRLTRASEYGICIFLLVFAGALLRVLLHVSGDNFVPRSNLEVFLEEDLAPQQSDGGRRAEVHGEVRGRGGNGGKPTKAGQEPGGEEGGKKSDAREFTNKLN